MSLDSTLKVWMPESNRSILLNQFFVCVKSVDVRGGGLHGGGHGGGSHSGSGSGTSHGLRSNARVWYTCGQLREGEDWALYVGDSEGSISVYEKFGEGGGDDDGDGDDENTHELDGLPLPPQAAISFGLSKKWSNIHSLSITTMLVVPAQNFLLTLSFDTTAQVLDATTGSVFLTIDNQARCRYTGLSWDPGQEQLLLVDGNARVEAWNVYTERSLGEETLLPTGQSTLQSTAGQRKFSREQEDKSNGDSKNSATICTAMSWCKGDGSGDGSGDGNGNGNGGGDGKFFLLFPSHGSLQLWTTRQNTSCAQFQGHAPSAVVAIICVAMEEERESQMQLCHVGDEEEKSGKSNGNTTQTKFLAEEVS